MNVEQLLKKTGAASVLDYGTVRSPEREHTLSPRS